jgi:hypothetical protein
MKRAAILGGPFHSEINRRNRWKYLILAAVLWGALFLIWWYRIRPALK